MWDCVECGEVMGVFTSVVLLEFCLGSGLRKWLMVAGALADGSLGRRDRDQKQRPPRTLQQGYAQGSRGVLGGGRFLVSDVQGLSGCTMLK